MKGLARYPFDALRDTAELVSDARARGWRPALATILSPEARGSWQFTKYLAIGGTSVVVFFAVCAVFRWAAVALGASYGSQRLLWNLVEITVGFIPTNAFTYETNRRWVFVAGRHAPRKEFVLFTAAAAASFVAGQTAAWYLITYSHVNDFLVKLGVIVVSTLINYAFRKFVVFHS
ncbi:GtrA family protein [Luteolibacter sp. LG18]|uniref:GtrA family protein n=1 Tax=Luteolibacter sp. LG18 TaxID=2819286 RepID=UPI002B30AD81|nr:hypothetical protein llg_16410 [Luteolibacter sp. LG18]